MRPYSTSIINLEAELRTALQGSGHPELRAHELAEEWLSWCLREIESLMLRWDDLGLGRPLAATGDGRSLVTCRHARYHSIAGSSALPRGYNDMLAFVDSLSAREFLLVPVCLLRACGCDPIIVTEGSDGGVDCLGRVATGALRSLCVFVQAKSGANDVTKSELITEYGKFQDLMSGKPMFDKYLAAAASMPNVEGRSICYVVVSRSDFERPARDYAFQERILLRPGIQVASLLCGIASSATLEAMRKDLGPTLKRDLSRNLGPLVESYLAT